MANKVLFNGLLYAPDGTGISRYAEHLVKEYIRLGYDVDILLRQDYQKDYAMYDNVLFASNEIHSGGQRILTEQWEMRRLYRDYELVHFPDYATPVLTHTASMATIHDMAMKTMRKQYTRKQNIVKNSLMKNTIVKANAISTVSQFSRAELLRYYPKMEQRCRVIPLGVDEPCQMNFDVDLLGKWGLQPKQYLLYVGTLAPHKNIVNLIKAFASVCRQGYAGKLVLVGGKGWMYEDIFAEVEKQQLKERIIFTGYVTDMELEQLYRFAYCFVSVSSYEGFGLPPLEAMIRGIPVLVSDIPVFHETVADCGLYASAQDTEQIAAQMMCMLQDTCLRNTLVEKGRAQAKLFTWEKTASSTWQYYQDILGGGR